MGIRAIGLGGAFAAIADDASAVYHNPAGLVFHKKRMSISLNGFHVRPNHEYVMPGGSVAHSTQNISFPQVFLSYETSERLTLGFGAYIPFAGGGVDWPGDELGFPFKSNLGVVSLTPSIAYRFSEKLSVGLSVNYFHSILDVNSEGGPFGTLKSKENGSALSGSLGLMFRPSPTISFGISVRGPAKLTLSGKTTVPVEVPGLGSMALKLKSETEFNLPWDVEVGVAFKVSENFLVSAGAQYTMWSVLDRIEKTVKGIPGEGDLEEYELLNFEDIMILRAGIEYSIPGGLFLRAGVGLDKSAAPLETLSITNIDVDKITLIGGIGYRVGNTQVDFVFVQANGKERERIITQFGFPLTERYNLDATILGLGVTFNF